MFHHSQEFQLQPSNRRMYGSTHRQRKILEKAYHQRPLHKQTFITQPRARPLSLYTSLNPLSLVTQLNVPFRLTPRLLTLTHRTLHGDIRLRGVEQIRGYR